MKLDLILRIVAKLVLPFMFVFALYVQYHGELGPGGGFQAGVIIAGMIILYAIMFGNAAARHVAPAWLMELMVPAGVLIYAGVGIVTMMLGHNFLDYGVLDTHSTVHGRERGIFWVEIGVLVTVSGTMISIFYAFTGRGR